MKSFSCAALGLVFCVTSILVHGHEHLAAGANSTAPGAPLVFVNAADFAAPSGFVFNFSPGESNSPYAGVFYTSDLVFEALASLPNNGGPEPLHAALGSRIALVLESLEGPPGGRLGFWETTVDDALSTNLTWSAAVNLSTAAEPILISESDGSPGSDPYGHKHGRIFSLTAEGLYRAGFRFVDTSTNGPAGGPIQSPSERFFLWFQAGLTLGSITAGAEGLTIQFATASNVEEGEDGTATQYTLESSPQLGPGAQWHAIGTPVAGDDHLHNLILPSLERTGFFRLRAE
jgi:hypothetical protein